MSIDMSRTWGRTYTRTRTHRARRSPMCVCGSPPIALLLGLLWLTCVCRSTPPSFLPGWSALSESPVRGKAQADSRVRARCDGYGRVGGCTGRSEASGSCECRACVRCGAIYLILSYTRLCDLPTRVLLCAVMTAANHSDNSSEQV